MQYLDSWVWLEYVLGGPADEAASNILDDAHNGSGVTSAISIAEVGYIVRRELGRETADYVTSSIDDAESIRVVPVSGEIAYEASGIRTKYYSRRERELSYADAIHVSTALHADCDVIHTGDSDFSGLDEIETKLHR